MNLSVKNLFQEKTKLAISVSGVSFALLLILVLSGVFAGIDRQATAYIRESKADVWVMQKGVSNMHMAYTIIPAALERDIKQVPGVRRVSSILYLGGFIEIKGKKTLGYIVGFDSGESAGGPWLMAGGTKKLARNEVIIDEKLAAKRGVDINDKITVLGRQMRIAGLSREAFSLANTITFVNRDAMESMVRAPGIRSYFLVSIDPGRSAGKVAGKIKRRVEGVNAMTTSALVKSDVRMLREMGIDLINAMSIIGFIVGVMVVGLTIFTATLEKSRDFGVLKAIGASRWRLYRVVIEQSLIVVALGFGAGLLLAFGTKAIIGVLIPDMQLVFVARDLIRAAIAMVVIGVLAAYIPIRRIAALDPMIVFKS